jgi:hypothetical protein
LCLTEKACFLASKAGELGRVMSWGTKR